MEVPGGALDVQLEAVWRASGLEVLQRREKAAHGALLERAGPDDLAPARRLETGGRSARARAGMRVYGVLGRFQDCLECSWAFECSAESAEHGTR